jgi:hypothetical protein
MKYGKKFLNYPTDLLAKIFKYIYLHHKDEEVVYTFANEAIQYYKGLVDNYVEVFNAQYSSGELSKKY